MDWKRNFLETSLLGRSTNRDDPNDVQLKCIDLAYKDMMTAGRYCGSSFSCRKEEICRAVNEKILARKYSFSRDLIEEISKEFCSDCDDRIKNGNRYATGYGLAQKLINMTFKYLYVFSDLIFADGSIPNFSLCDCPLDSNILKKTPITGVVWSKLIASQYQECQDEISDLLKEETLDSELSKLGNLAFDFLKW